jgi:hypothetical protein
MPTRSIIVTDLTRFTNDQIVCIAGTDTVSRLCVRPMPYLEKTACERLQILPGAILTGVFTPTPNLVGPHQEDTTYESLHFDGPCTSDQFKDALQAGLFNSISEGFEIDLTTDQKHIPLDHELGRSIITIRVDPANIDLVEDAYNPGRIKLHLIDGSGHSFRYLPITDLGFYRHAMAHQEIGDLENLNAFLHEQEEVYMRIGLSRNWDKRPGYWMQVNGIYTFPEYHQDIRSYV